MCTQKFDKSYLAMAEVWAQNSYAKRAKVGALIVKNGQIISDGFNGTPSGFDNCCEDVMCTCQWIHGCRKDARPISEVISPEHCSDCSDCKMVTKKEVLHAEANAITKLSRSTQSSDGATLYVTLSPCYDCAKLIIQSGIKRVVYKEQYRETSGLDLLKSAGIEVVNLK